MIRPVTCAICRKPLPLGDDGTCATFPFCSERCRQVDLFRWFDGKYAISEPLSPEEIEEARELDPDTPTADEDLSDNSRRVE